jgi:hypothetical protein
MLINIFLVRLFCYMSQYKCRYDNKMICETDKHVPIFTGEIFYQFSRMSELESAISKPI